MTVEVKICGISTVEALAAAIDGGADYVGLVHFAPSPRHVGLERAGELARAARSLGKARSVALLVDPCDALIEEVVARVDPDLIQLHGRESCQRVREIRIRAGRPLIKAVAVATAEDVVAAEAYLAPGACADIVLLDAKPPPDPGTLPGGNGLAFDWRIVAGLSRRMPFALAGGLTPDNVADAIRLTHAHLVDVSSGVERAPGVKDVGLIRRFLLAAKTAKQAA